MASAADHVPEEPVDKMGDEEGAGTSVAVAGEGQLKEELKWKPATPVITRNASVPIWTRMATETDVRPEKPNPKSKWSRSKSREHEREQSRRRSRVGESHDESRRKPSTQGISLGVQKTRDAIAKVKAKKITRADLDKPLSS
ncbi:unnamed protein product [Chondrus crispus]|uniref:Uncharacterized protein n=1 Tax=Chondrus crispus TaxID=2769 RepID=R7QE06_CHOCR|nr:unnamed protein product [Chondrus crispus]CDF36319.1 unnamed protein product [Chondrus crispus]|eukprot:XP_005716138.1 unnamed protein product [Chondrus crispus]